YYAQQRTWLAEEVGVPNVDRTIGDLYAQGIYRLYSAPGSSGSQRKQLKAVQKNLKKAKLPQAEELKRLGRIQEAIRVQDWKELASILHGVANRGDIVYNQSLPTSLGQYVPTLLKATGSKYVEQAQKWSDTLLSKLDNLLDKSKVWDI